jgi:hypothetical protein
MIRGMWKRVLAALIILGWISLPGLDVVEDLDEVPGQSRLSTAPNEFKARSKHFWQFIDFHDESQPLPNNIIELANRTKATTIEAVTFSLIIFHYVRPADFRKHSLHKLLRVFLI